ncbi:MAG: hypothetical protein ACKOUM_01600 [Sphingopyxis sp.]
MGLRFTSFRTRLRAFQTMHGGSPDPGFVADLDYLENRDLDLSIRLGGLLAFNALLVTIGTHPISASPGAPLSLDAPTQPWLVLASIIGIIPIIASSWFCLHALLIGEEFETDGPADDVLLRQRLFAAFIRSIDAQTLLLRRAIWSSVGGSTMTLAVWAWIILSKII